MVASSQFPVAVIPRDREGVLPLGAHSTSPARRGSPWSIDEPAGDIFGRDVCVNEEQDFLGEIPSNSWGCITNPLSVSCAL